MNKQKIKLTSFIFFTWILIIINIYFDGTSGILIKISQFLSYICLIVSGILIIGIELKAFSQNISKYRNLMFKERFFNEVYG